MEVLSKVNCKFQIILIKIPKTLELDSKIQIKSKEKNQSKTKTKRNTEKKNTWKQFTHVNYNCRHGELKTKMQKANLQTLISQQKCILLTT